MIIDGQELRSILERTENAIELRNEHGRCCRRISREEALRLDLDLFVGIGNRRRIRFLRPLTQRFAINAGSRTTQRMKDQQGMNFTHPVIREHRKLL
jgi:hypothetical protein